MRPVSAALTHPATRMWTFPSICSNKKATGNTAVGIPVALPQDPIDSILAQERQYDGNSDCSQHAIASLLPFLDTGSNE
jgi:hypothetical protein